MDGAGSPPLVMARGLVRRFEVSGGPFSRRRYVHAVNGVSFDLACGAAFALVGESGCGKSTVGRLILGLDIPDEGSVAFNGKPITGSTKAAWRAARRHMQMVFQDVSGTLDPRMRIFRQVREPLDIHAIGTLSERDDAVGDVLASVGLDNDIASRFPHELSGGQQQRVVIARALVLRPQLIVCDEPVSGLDVSVQAQLVNLLCALKQRYRIAYLFISHNLAVVRHIADRVGVMYLGELVEIADIEDLFTAPKHPYTQALISAVPVPDPGVIRERILLSGDPPSPVDLPAGCTFRSRCPVAAPVCAERKPALGSVGPSHLAACHFPGPVGGTA